MRLEYRRQNLHFSASQVPKGVVLGIKGMFTQWNGSIAEEINQAEPPGLSDIAGAVERACEEFPAEEETSRPGSDLLPRLVLHLHGPDLHSYDWERALAAIPGVGRYFIVRASPVLPRVTQLPFTLPLRIAHIDPLPRHALGVGVAAVFGHLTPEKVQRIVRARRFKSQEFQQPWDDWPTSEVLHFDRVPWNSPKGLLSNSERRTPGSLGWLLRLSDVFQTRLVVFHCAPPELTAARLLAAELTAWGGPAVLICERSSHSEAYFRSFYNGVIHDRPFDHYPTWVQHGYRGQCLFVGAGREELVRFSNLYRQLLDLKQGLGRSGLRSPGGPPNLPDPHSGFPRVEDSSGEPMATSPKLEFPTRKRRLDLSFRNLSLRTREARPVKTRSVRQAASEVRDCLRGLSAASYDFAHERDGVVPMSDLMENLRDRIGIRQAGSFEMVTTEAGRRLRKPRHVNARFWEQAPQGLRAMPQHKARFVVGDLYHLGIDIGPKEPELRTLGIMGFLEEAIKWTPEMTGIWLEVGLTGIDFQVLGSSVQHLWLPRGHPSDRIFFAVKPLAAGVGRLRFCLYYKQNVLQSFLVAAVTARHGRRLPPPRRRKALLAKALGIDEHRADDHRYLSRLEYSMKPDLEGEIRLPERQLSLVANDLDGRTVVTVKGEDLFAVHGGEFGADADLPTYVRQLRESLMEESQSPVPDSRLFRYRYLDGGRANQGSPQELSAALRRLAERGWELCHQLFPDPEVRQRLATILADERQVVQIAHIVLEKTIPWAALYLRPYDAAKASVHVAGEWRPAAHETCLAALPTSNGKLPVKECGSHLQCLLHPDRIRERLEKTGEALVSETVACPLQFLGFRHLIELPPQQSLEGSGAAPLCEAITCGAVPRIFTGAHGGLRLVDNHLEELRKMVGSLRRQAQLDSPAFHRDAVLEELKDPDLDVIYLYCHADGRRDNPAFWPPRLRFQDKRKGLQEGTITSGQLAYATKWKHHPLVFLNGCGTAGFSPEALSPFIKTLVQGRGAAGIIGTEVEVYEELAGEMARHFLAAFLDGATAGDALLDARRSLLAKNNPLGLVYTLYAAAHLTLAPPLA